MSFLQVVRSESKSIIAIFFADASIIAVLPVPYLTLKSVYLITTKKADVRFAQMLREKNVWFWVLGPASATLSTIAITPFNAYNAFVFVKDFHLPPLKECIKIKNITKNILQISMMISGSVNGYFVSMAFRDIAGIDTTVTQVIHFVLVANGVIFAGLSDSRTLSSYFRIESARDLRFLARPVRSMITCCKNRFFKPELSISKRRKKILARLRHAFDDLYMICQLGISDEQLSQFSADLISGLSAENVDDLRKYFVLLEEGFPTMRFLGSEILGSIVSTVWAYFGNRNSITFASKAVKSFLTFCGMAEDGWATFLFSKFSGYMSFAIGSFLSFFLIRDLFFREIFKNKSYKSFPEFFKYLFSRVMLPSLPAFCYGLINIIASYVNPDLGPAGMVITAGAALVGATVVSRYGIDNGVRRLAGVEDLRRSLAQLSEHLMTEFAKMDNERLFAVYDTIKPFVEKMDDKLVEYEFSTNMSV